MSPDPLPCVEIESPPASSASGAVSQATCSVIWLHGLGADGHDFEPIVPELGLPPELRVRFVFPNAPRIPVTINGGMVMPAWYDILAMDFHRKVDEAGLSRSVEQVTALLDRERERGIPSDRLVVAGFSQGGAIALHLGLRAPIQLAGIMALSTYLACDGDLELERTEAGARTPVFQAHGTQDPMVPLALGQAARERLLALDQPLEWHEYPMGHEVCAEEIAAAGTWLRGVLELGRQEP